MKNSMSNFSELALSRTEMKNVTGGCAWSCSGDGWGRSYGSYAQASAGAIACVAAGYRGFWCCASC